MQDTPTTIKTAVKDISKNVRILLNDEIVQLTGKRFVAGKDVPELYLAAGAECGYIFETTHELGAIFTSPVGYLEVVVS